VIGIRIMNIVGLPNFGNTCYFNSILQILIYNEKLFDILQSTNIPQNDFIKYIVCLQKVSLKATISLNENIFVMLVRNIYIKLIDISYFEPKQPEDASCCLGFMLDYFHETIKHPVEMTLQIKKPGLIEQKAFDSWSRYFQKSYSPIIKAFYGQYGSIIRCSMCKQDTHTFEPFNVLALPVIQEKSIMDCFQRFFEIEKITDYKCDHCKSVYKHYKQTRLFILPSFLFIQLKNINNENSNKHEYSEYSSDLDLTPYCYNTQAKYKLYAVVYHMGSLTNGHYNMCRKIEEKYIIFDDTNVYRVDKFPTQNMSILCYERID